MEALKANKREKRVVHEAKKERKVGKVPGNLYGKHLANIMFEVGALELDGEIAKNGEHGVFNLSIDGVEHKTVIKEIQREPINHKLIHIDLEEIASDTLIHTDIPLVFSGEETVVKNGGMVQKEKNKVKIQCKGDQVPKSINVNISSLKIGDTFRVSDIEIAHEITFMEDANSIIVAVTKVGASESLDENNNPAEVQEIKKAEE